MHKHNNKHKSNGSFDKSKIDPAAGHKSRSSTTSSSHKRSYQPTSSRRSASHNPPSHVRTTTSTCPPPPQSTVTDHRQRTTTTTTTGNQHQQPARPRRTKMRQIMTDYCGMMKRTPLPIPPSLLKSVLHDFLDPSRKENLGLGKIKMMLKVTARKSENTNDYRDLRHPRKRDDFLKFEPNRRHISIYSPDCDRNTNLAPKKYSFDAVFSDDTPVVEICMSGLNDVIQSVLQGADGTVLCYGQVSLGKTSVLLRWIEGESTAGVIPSGISWVYQCIEELRKRQVPISYTAKISAIEVYGRSEKLRDLLLPYKQGRGAPSEPIRVSEDPLVGAQLHNVSEVVASTAVDAAYLLDAALAHRSCSGDRNTTQARRHSHFIYTINLYRHDEETPGNRSRLHFIDLGSCEKNLIKTPKSLALSFSSLGHVIMAIVNNSKHVPFRESKLTCVLREVLGNVNCRVSILAHVSRDISNYSDTLSTVQMASRIHRVLRKKNKSSGNGGGVSRQNVLNKATFEAAYISSGSSGSKECTSGSELSCDTVVYNHMTGGLTSDCTDSEPTSAQQQQHWTPISLRKSASGSSESDEARRMIESSTSHVETPTFKPIPILQTQQRINHRVNKAMIPTTDNTRMLSAVGKRATAENYHHHRFEPNHRYQQQVMQHWDTQHQPHAFRAPVLLSSSLGVRPVLTVEKSELRPMKPPRSFSNKTPTPPPQAVQISVPPSRPGNLLIDLNYRSDGNSFRRCPPNNQPMVVTRGSKALNGTMTHDNKRPMTRIEEESEYNNNTPTTTTTTAVNNNNSNQFVPIGEGAYTPAIFTTSSASTATQPNSRQAPDGCDANISDDVSKVALTPTNNYSEQQQETLSFTSLDVEADDDEHLCDDVTPLDLDLADDDWWPSEKMKPDEAKIADFYRLTFDADAVVSNTDLMTSSTPCPPRDQLIPSTPAASICGDSWSSYRVATGVPPPPRVNLRNSQAMTDGGGQSLAMKRRQDRFSKSFDDIFIESTAHLKQFQIPGGSSTTSSTASTNNGRTRWTPYTPQPFDMTSYHHPRIGDNKQHSASSSSEGDIEMMPMMMLKKMPELECSYTLPRRATTSTAVKSDRSLPDDNGKSSKSTKQQRAQTTLSIQQQHLQRPGAFADSFNAPFRLYDSHSLEISYLDTRLETAANSMSHHTDLASAAVTSFRSSDSPLNMRKPSSKVASSSSFVVSTSTASTDGTRLTLVKNKRDKDQRPVLELMVTGESGTDATLLADDAKASICNALSVPQPPERKPEKLRVSAEYLLSYGIRSSEKPQKSSPNSSSSETSSWKKSRWLTGWARFGSRKTESKSRCKLGVGVEKLKTPITSRNDVMAKVDSPIDSPSARGGFNPVWYLKQEESPWKKKLGGYPDPISSMMGDSGGKDSTADSSSAKPTSKTSSLGRSLSRFGFPKKSKAK